MFLLARLLPVPGAIFHICFFSLRFLLLFLRAEASLCFGRRSVGYHIFIFLFIGFRRLSRHILHRFIHIRADVAFVLLRVEFVYAWHIGDDFGVWFRRCFDFYFTGIRFRGRRFPMRNRSTKGGFEGGPTGFVFCEDEKLLVGIGFELGQDQVVHTAQQTEKFTHFAGYLPHHF